jgi:hypothetical protein
VKYQDWFNPLRTKSLKKEYYWNTVFQILSEDKNEQLKILYEELRKRIPNQDYGLIKWAIKEEKKKDISNREVKSVLDCFKVLLAERKVNSNKRNNKTKNIKKRRQRRERVKRELQK